MLAPRWVPEAVVADLVQTFGQNVLQESAHELVAVQAGVLPFPGLALFVADGNAVVVETDNAVVGDRNAEQITGEIAEHGVIPFAPGGAMHDPRLSPCSVRHDEVRPALCERRSELAAHEFGQGLERD